MIPRHSPPFGAGHVVLSALNFLGRVDVEQVESRFAETFKISYAVLLPSVRAGINWALKTSIETGTTVLCPAYTCEVVHEAIVRAGGRLQLIDAEKDGFLMDQMTLRSEQIGNHAVVLCEIYGHTYDLGAISQNTKSEPVIRIVDMAMTVPNLKLIERLQNNDVGFLSFGIGKCMYSGWGGMCFTKNANLAEGIKRIRNSSLIKASLWLLFKRNIEIFLRTLAHNRNLYGSLRKINDVKLSRTQHSESKDNPMHLWRSNEGLSREWLVPSGCLDRILACYNMEHSEHYSKRRLSLANRYYDNLKSSPGIVPPAISDFPLSHYTVRVNPVIRSHLIEYLWKIGIDVGTLFPFPAYISKYDYPNASRIASEVVNLPLGGRLRLEDVDLVSESMIGGVMKLCE